MRLTEGDSSYGVNVHTSGANSQGVNAYSSGANSPGVSAISSQDTGVYGRGKIGAYFTTNQAGTRSPGYAGVNVSTAYQWNPGIRVQTTGIESDGILSRTLSEQSTGILTQTWGAHSRGFHAITEGDESAGLTAYTSGEVSEAVRAYSKGAGSEGISTYSDQANGIDAETGKADYKYGVYTPDYIYAKGTQYPSWDVAEYMPVLDDVSPGTVLIIRDDGRLVSSSAAYDTRVAGIVSTDPGIFLGTRDDGNPGEALIAIAGRVPCRADAAYGAIRAGDLLTRSDTPGHAMKAEPTIIGGRGCYPDGTILGKAMGFLESGTGTIEVLVTLQ